MMQQVNRNHAYRQTSQQMSNLPSEDQLRVKFANRGIGAVCVNQASFAHQQQTVRPQQTAYLQRQNARPQQAARPQQTVRPQQNAIQRSDSRPPVTQVPLYAVKARSTPLPTAMLLCMMVCTMMILSVVWGSAMVGRAAEEVDALESQVAELANAERELSRALDQKNDLRTIERIAVDELGMIGTDLITKKYISVSGIDVIEAFDSEDKESVGLSTLLSAIGVGVN